MKQGGKAHSLEALRDKGFRVPQFVVCKSGMLKADIREALDTHLSGVKYFAVRSSADVEDSSSKSFAGHFYTGIGIARKDVYEEYTKVLRSYAGASGVVIVQEFIASERAGVLFTTTSSGKSVINASQGLCQPVVSGGACDEYIVGGGGVLISSTIAPHKQVLRFANGSFSKSQSSTSSLADDDITQVVLLGKKIESLFGTPQDIEWCFAGDVLYALQSRPITQHLALGVEEYFDSANIAESYSGIVLPLTSTFASFVYSHVYRDLLHMSGVSRALLEKHRGVFDNLLGFFYGRMYYTMNNWYRLAEFVPGYRRNKENFELMITSNVKEEVDTVISPSIWFTVFYPLIVGVKVLFYGLTAQWFQSMVENYLREMRMTDFSKLTYDDSIQLFNRINTKLLRRWYITLENDFFVMTYLGILKKMLGEEKLQSILVFKSKATEQVSALSELAKSFSSIPSVWQSVRTGDREGFFRELAAHSECQERYQTYLEEFGGRFASELKLETVGIDEDITKFFAVLQAYRTYTEPETAPQMAIKLPFARQLLINFIVGKFKKYASRRESFRLLRSNTFAVARRLFRHMGLLLVKAGVIDSVDDVFYMTLDELLDSRATVNRDLRAKVAERKKQYAGYREVSPPSHFKTVDRVPPVFGKEGSIDVEALRGRPASAGVVRGRVRLFKEFLMPSVIDFDIMVTAHTDPGWTSLIALSKGLIIEHGGVLSHASIVARELGVPAVIGAAGALSTLKDGQLVEIDGGAGTIKII